MTINGETMILIAEELDELRARQAVMYDGVLHAVRIARKALLPQGDHEDALRRVVDVLKHAQSLCDSLNNAAHMKGYEIVDEEITDLAKAAGGFHYLTPDAQIAWIAARKRAAVQGALTLRSDSAAQEPSSPTPTAGVQGGVARSLTIIP